IRGQPGIVGMAGAAGLAGLPGEARQSTRWRRKLNNKKCSKQKGRHGDERQKKMNDCCSLFAHNTSSLPFRLRNSLLNGGEVRIRKKSGQGYVVTLTIRISCALMLFGNSTAIDADQCPTAPKRQYFHARGRSRDEIQTGGRRGYHGGTAPPQYN